MCFIFSEIFIYLSLFLFNFFWVLYFIIKSTFQFNDLINYFNLKSNEHFLLFVDKLTHKKGLPFKLKYEYKCVIFNKNFLMKYIILLLLKAHRLYKT